MSGTFTIRVDRLRWHGDEVRYAGIVTCPHGLLYKATEALQTYDAAMVVAADSIRIGDCGGDEADCACLKMRGNQFVRSSSSAQVEGV